MLSGEPGEDLSRENPFRITSYRDGHYDINGQFKKEPKFSHDVTEKWERDNQEKLGGKAWGAGQGLFFKDRPITFGRAAGSVDVVISCDLTPEGGSQEVDLTVSRKHFELEPPKYERIVIKNLGSENGETIYREGKLLKEVNLADPRSELMVGDWVLFGKTRHPEDKEGRALGFRVFKDAGNKLFLVKFNLEKFKDMFTIIGHSLKPVGETHLPKEVTEWPQMEKATHAAYGVLIADLTNLENVAVTNGSSREAFKNAKEFYLDLFSVVGNNADLFLSGDVARAAGYIGQHALDQSEISIRQNKPEDALRQAKLATILNNIANGKYIE